MDTTVRFGSRNDIDELPNERHGPALREVGFKVKSKGEPYLTKDLCI